MHSNLCAFLLSCPARGTWIEIVEVVQNIYANEVVPRKGHVD